MEQRMAKWRRWIDGPIKASVITMHHHRQVWRGIGKVIEEHGDLPPSAWWEHYFDVYAETQAMAVRRQADLHPDVASLGKLLAEVTDDAQALTPDWWLGLWSLDADDEYERAFARRQWDQEFGGGVGTHLDPAIPEGDLERLMTGSERVKRHVDKHIAHSEDPGVRPRDPGETASDEVLRLDEIDDAIDMIGTIFNRYYSLMTAASMAFLEPAIQHDWLAPFREPWIGDHD